MPGLLAVEVRQPAERASEHLPLVPGVDAKGDRRRGDLVGANEPGRLRRSHDPVRVMVRSHESVRLMVRRPAGAGAVRVR